MNYLRVLVVEDITNPEIADQYKSSIDFPYNPIFEYIETDINPVNEMLNWKVGERVTLCPICTTNNYNVELIHKAKQRIVIGEPGWAPAGVYFTTALIFKQVE